MERTLTKNLFHKLDKQEALRGIFLISLFIVLSLIVGRSIGQAQLEQRVIQTGIRGPILIICWKALSVIFIPFSGSIIYIISGGLYGTWKAVVFGVIGNAIGMSGAFYIGRKRGKKAVVRLVGEKHITEVIHLISHLGNSKMLTISRIVLFPLEDFINYAAGMSTISFRKYFVISIVITTIFSLLPIIFGHLVI